jgi:hypothetical protein
MDSRSFCTVQELDGSTAKRLLAASEVGLRERDTWSFMTLGSKLPRVLLTSNIL